MQLLEAVKCMDTVETLLIPLPQCLVDSKMLSGSLWRLPNKMWDTRLIGQGFFAASSSVYFCLNTNKYAHPPAHTRILDLRSATGRVLRGCKAALIVLGISCLGAQPPPRCPLCTLRGLCADLLLCQLRASGLSTSFLT